MSFIVQSQSAVCDQLSIPGSTSVSQLESKFGFENVAQLADTAKRLSSHL